MGSGSKVVSSEEVEVWDVDYTWLDCFLDYEKSKAEQTTVQQTAKYFLFRAKCMTEQDREVNRATTWLCSW